MIDRRFLGLLLFTSLGFALSPSLAGADEVRENPKAVIELFTSQGCASCPPADALLTELAKRKDIIALAYHVDYWDYVGWPDTFGAEDNSNYQRSYASAWGSGRIYTPQMVINGAKGVVGSKKREVASALGEASLPLSIDLDVGNDMLSVDIEGQAGLGDAVVWLVTYLDKASVAIERGENSGAKLDYTQVVTGRQAVGMWEPGAGSHFKLPLSQVMPAPSNGAVIVVQMENQGLPGPILGAASLQN